MKAWMLAAFGRSAEPITLPPFTEDIVVTIPAGVAYVSLSGHGAAGEPSKIVDASSQVVFVNYRTDVSTGTGNATWDALQGLAPAVANMLNNGNSSSYDRYAIDVWPDGTNTFQAFDTFISSYIRGTAVATTSAGWKTSGPIQNSASSSVTYKRESPATTGASATGFGRTFAGGQYGQPTPTTTFNDVPVTPGQQYQLRIPAGGSITISYYQ